MQLRQKLVAVLELELLREVQYVLLGSQTLMQTSNDEVQFADQISGDG